MYVLDPAFNLDHPVRNSNYQESAQLRCSPPETNLTIGTNDLTGWSFIAGN